jgi:putative ABC transport system permease protein
MMKFILAAAATLVLAALGLAAVLGFAIRRRSAEIGLRMAVGATPSRVRRLVLRQGGGLVVAGIGLGVVTGIALARLLAGRLHGVGIADPLTWSVVTGMVLAIALAACWLPAHRAARTDPLVALRSE